MKNEAFRYSGSMILFREYRKNRNMPAKLLVLALMVKKKVFLPSK